MARTDLLIDDDGDELLDANGDYIEGPSDEQEAWLAVETVKGENRQFPTAGFGIDLRIRKRAGQSPLVENPTRFKRDLKIELEADGHVDPQITVTNDLSDFKVSVG